MDAHEAPYNMLGRQGAVLHSPLMGLFQRLVDLAVLIAAGIVARSLFGFESILPLLFAFLYAALFVICGEAFSLYHSWRAQALGEEVGAILLTAITALVVAAAVTWPLALSIPTLATPLNKHGFQGSVMLGLAWSATVVVLLLLYRIGLRALLRALRSVGLNHKPVLLIGSIQHRTLLADRMASVPWYGFDVIGGEDLAALSTEAGRAALLARARQGEFEHIYLMGSTDRDLVASLLAGLADTPVSTYLVPDIFFNELIRPRIYSIAGVPAIGITTSRLLGSGEWLKRGEDLILASLILVLIAVPMVLIALAIKMTTPGPVIFRQVRYGLDGQPITVLKFRTMTVCEDGDTVKQACRADQRVTRLGAFLRRTSMDELPQFLNVLSGEMSIVGPRPHARAHAEYYRRLIPNYILRHKIKPGVTGWAQVNGWRGETDELYKMEKRIDFDLEYIRNWSVWFDLRIVVRTIFHVVLAKDVY
jgi:putative colanic acid biosynthesis UDP-glucose lipid carrier transferase